MGRKIVMDRSTYIEFILDVVIHSPCEEFSRIDWPLVDCVFGVIVDNSRAYNIMYELKIIMN